MEDKQAAPSQSNQTGHAQPGRQFEFVPGPGPEALRVILRGFWDKTTVAAYREALRQRALDAGGMTSVTRVLLDFRECLVQSQSVVDEMEEIARGYASQIDEYALLLLSESPLLRIQMKRLSFNVPIRYFENDAEAAAWLESAPERPA